MFVFHLASYMVIYCSFIDLPYTLLRKRCYIKMDVRGTNQNEIIEETFYNVNVKLQIVK